MKIALDKSVYYDARVTENGKFTKTNIGSLVRVLCSYCWDDIRKELVSIFYNRMAVAALTEDSDSVLLWERRIKRMKEIE